MLGELGGEAEESWLWLKSQDSAGVKTKGKEDC
jgi:hypothetical protein